jgi:hypothetical protein
MPFSAAIEPIASATPPVSPPAATSHCAAFRLMPPPFSPRQPPHFRHATSFRHVSPLRHAYAGCRFSLMRRPFRRQLPLIADAFHFDAAYCFSEPP